MRTVPLLISCCLLWPAAVLAAPEAPLVSALAGGKEAAIDVFPWTGKQVERVFVSLPQAVDAEGILVVPCVKSAPLPKGMKLAGRGLASFGDGVDVFPIEAEFKAAPDGWRASLSNVASFEVRAFDLVLPVPGDVCAEAIRVGNLTVTPFPPVAGAVTATEGRSKLRQAIRGAFRDAGAEGVLDHLLADKGEQWRIGLFDDGTFVAWGRTPEVDAKPKGSHKWKDYRAEGTFELGTAAKGKREIRLSGIRRAFDRSTRPGSDEVARKPAGESKVQDVLSVSAAGVEMRSKKPVLGFSRMTAPLP